MKSNQTAEGSVKKHFIILACWVTLAFGLGIFGYALGPQLVIPGPTSKEALLGNKGEQIASAAGLTSEDIFLLLLGHPTLTSDNPSFITVRDSLFLDLKNLKRPNRTESLFVHLETAGHTLMGDERFSSGDNQHVLIKGETAASIDTSDIDLKQIPDLVSYWKKKFPEYTISYLSNGTANNELFALIDKDLDRSLLYTLPITLLILFWAFGSVMASAVTLFTALVCLVASLGISALMSEFIEPISATASQLVVLLVLAIGVDYSLFFISRVREEVAKGLSYPQAITRSRRTTGIAIFWSGLTVALSLFGLLLMKDHVLTSMAIVSITSVLITVSSTLYVLPSLLVILGNRIEIGSFGRKINFNNQSSIVSRWLKISIHHPIQVLLSSGFFVIAVSLFCFYIKLGCTVQAEMMPKKMQGVEAFSLLKKHFPDLAGVDLSIVLHATQLEDLESSGDLQEFFDEISAQQGMHGPFQIDKSEDGTTERLHYIVSGTSNDPANRELVRLIESEFIPKHLRSKGVEGYLTGTLPFEVDEVAIYSKRTPIVFAIVLACSIVFLLIAFRSVIIPIKAVILNILSTTASFGILVILFQFLGWHFGVIEGFVPALLFSILFGLSMDYHVFLLSRVREEVLMGATTKEAVEGAIVETSRVITSAALIMVSVFGVIASLELPLMKQLGVGLGFAVLLDATIIRSMLLPASLVLLGKWNWYFPKWLQWLPEIQLD